MDDKIISYELTKLLKKIKTDTVVEFPIQEITLNYFIYTLLQTENNEVTCWLHDKLSTTEFNKFISLSILEIENDIKKSTIPQNQIQPYFNKDYDELIENSKYVQEFVNSAIFFSEIVAKKQIYKNFLYSNNITNDDIIVELLQTPIKPKTKSKSKKKNNNGLPKRSIQKDCDEIAIFCKNLLKEIAQQPLQTILGLDDIVNQIFNVLSKYERNNILLIGEHGTGKTATITRLTQKLYLQECPDTLKNKSIIEFGDQISTELINIISEEGRYITVIEDIDKLLINKDTEAQNLFVLQELVESPNMLAIYTINKSTYLKCLQNKPSFLRFFHTIEIPTFDDEMITEIVDIASHKFVEYNNTIITHENIKTAIQLSNKYITIEKQPAATLNLLDYATSIKNCESSSLNPELLELKKQLVLVETEKNSIPTTASAKHYEKKDELIRQEIKLKQEIKQLESKKKEQHTLTDNDIKKALSQIVNIPLTELNTDEKTRLSKLYNNLTDYVIGQDEAVSVVTKAVKRQRIGLSNPNKPCTLLFVGESGVGKTFLAKRLAHEMFGDVNKIVRFDMSEYSDKTSLNKLTGAGPGYIGYEDGGLLTEAIKNKKHCVLLLDEIEKAHKDIYNVFLQVFDEGRLTDSKGFTVDFKNVIIIMTSNVGTQAISETNKPIGFTGVTKPITNQEIILKSIKKEFRPEFINRIDNICYFNNLNDDNIRQIIKNEIKHIQTKVKQLGYDLAPEILDGELVDVIMKNIESEREYGARPIIREIQKLIEDKITDFIIDNDISKGYIFQLHDIYNKENN